MESKESVRIELSGELLAVIYDFGVIGVVAEPSGLNLWKQLVGYVENNY